MTLPSNPTARAFLMLFGLVLGLLDGSANVSFFGGPVCTAACPSSPTSTEWPSDDELFTSCGASGIVGGGSVLPGVAENWLLPSVIVESSKERILPGLEKFCFNRIAAWTAFSLIVLESERAEYIEGIGYWNFDGASGGALARVARTDASASAVSMNAVKLSIVSESSLSWKSILPS